VSAAPLYRWNETKRRRNAEKHGVDFAATANFDWERAVVLEDRRRDYGERRYRAFGAIRGRLHCLVFTQRGGRVHVISLRKANSREVRRHGESRSASAKEGGR
jgi:uncharacterized DUF497 family protein